MDERKLERLLWAYLDGALRPAARRKVERLLRRPEVGQLYAELCQLSQVLKSLPSKTTPVDFADDLVERLAQLETSETGPDARPSPATAPTPRSTGRGASAGQFLQQLLNEPELVIEAFADGCLCPDERRHCEEQLLYQACHRAVLEETQEIKSLVRSLPRLPAPLGFSAALLARLRREVAGAAVIGRTWGFWRAGGLLAASILLWMAAVAQVPFGPKEADHGPVIVAIRNLPSDNAVVDADVVDTPATTPLPPESALRKAASAEAGIAATKVEPAKGTIRAIAAARAATPVPDSRATPPMGPRLDELASLKPGELVTLDRQQISLLCVDVERMLNRLRITLMENRIAVEEASSVAGVAAERPSPQMYVFEVSTTPGQLGEVFSRLRNWEKDAPLIAQVHVGKSGMEALEKAGKPAGTDWDPVPAEAEPVPGPVNPPLANHARWYPIFRGAVARAKDAEVPAVPKSLPAPPTPPAADPPAQAGQVRIKLVVERNP